MPHLAFCSSLCVVGPKAKFSKLKIWKIESRLKGTVLVGKWGGALLGDRDREVEASR
jgi:hypothetical protein